MTIDPQLVRVAIVAAFVGAAMTHLLVPLTARVAVALGVLDRPCDRKLHDAPVPRLGGLAIVVGLILGAATVLVSMWDQWQSLVEIQGFLALALSTALIFLVGLVDDLIGLSALNKILVETIAAGLLVSAGWTFEVFAIPGIAIELGAWSGVITILWLVGVTNAINLIDGLDGLAAGVVAIIGLSFLTFTLFYESPLAVAVIAALFGSCVGFLPHNWEPAKIFMGDAGSLTLGFLLASMSVFSTLKAPAAVAILVPLLALGVPIIDTLLVMAVRFLERPKGRFFQRFLRIFHADRNHLHHTLESIVRNRGSVVRWIYFMVLVSCLMAVIVALTKRSGLGVVLLAVELAAVFAVRRFGMARRAQEISQERRQGIVKGSQPAS